MPAARVFVRARRAATGRTRRRGDALAPCRCSVPAPLPEADTGRRAIGTSLLPWPSDRVSRLAGGRRRAGGRCRGRSMGIAPRARWHRPVANAVAVLPSGAGDEGTRQGPGIAIVRGGAVAAAAAMRLSGRAGGRRRAVGRCRSRSMGIARRARWRRPVANAVAVLPSGAVDEDTRQGPGVAIVRGGAVAAAAAMRLSGRAGGRRHAGGQDGTDAEA